MSRRINRRGRGATRPLTEAEYRELIQTFVDRARSDQSIAEQLAEEARMRFGAEIDAPGRLSDLPPVGGSVLVPSASQCAVDATAAQVPVTTNRTIAKMTP